MSRLSFIAAACQHFGVHHACDVSMVCEKDPTCIGIHLGNRSSGHILVDLFHHYTQLQQFQNPSQFLETEPDMTSYLCQLSMSWDAPCARHGQLCTLGAADLDITGTPCQDWSGLGLRSGVFGSRFSIFLGWVHWILFSQPPVVIHENVREFDPTVLARYLAHAYHICLIECDCAETGMYALSRRRSYAVLYHKLKVRVLTHPAWAYCIISEAIVCSGSVCRSILSLFTATSEDIRDELAPLCIQKGVAVDAGVACPWVLLSASEKQRLQLYIRMWQQTYGYDPALTPNAVFNLQDNPTARNTHSGASFRIPCPRTGGGKLWSCYKQRWLLPKELMSAFGIPVHPEHAAVAAVPTFALPENVSYSAVIGHSLVESESFLFAALLSVLLDPLAMSCHPAECFVVLSLLAQGNMMHTSSVGAVTLAALVSASLTQ